jgi:hydroxypyruvate isomerase
MKTKGSNDIPGAVTLSRRKLITGAAGAAVAASATLSRLRAQDASEPYRATKQRIRQSVVHWCFKPMTVEQLAAQAARLGCQSVELIGPEHWPTLKKHGLICAISGSHGFAKGFAHVEEHEGCIASLRKSIDATAEAGWPSVITFSGFRRGISDEQGTKNMVEGLKKIAGYAERRKVTLCVEMLNSRVNVEMKGHPDYFCDDIDKTVEICRLVSSERVKVLFDIYHVQIMQGDVITRLRKHAPWIGHYHTAGVPGRAEIDDTQEINYPPIMKAIVETGYKGFVGQEFIPVRDKVASLEQAVRLCDV